jgi:hypothetical protein
MPVLLNNLLNDLFGHLTRALHHILQFLFGANFFRSHPACLTFSAQITFAPRFVIFASKLFQHLIKVLKRFPILCFFAFSLPVHITKLLFPFWHNSIIPADIEIDLRPVDLVSPAYWCFFQ